LGEKLKGGGENLTWRRSNDSQVSSRIRAPAFLIHHLLGEKNLDHFGARIKPVGIALDVHFSNVSWSCQRQSLHREAAEKTSGHTSFQGEERNFKT